jgi:putative ABC transport system substrate-binding protein
VWPLTTYAQPPARVRRIGFLSGGSRPLSLVSSPLGAFARGMTELGYVEGRDFVMEWRFADGRYELLHALADELVDSKVDVIVLGTPLAVRAAQQATSTIPIVMAVSVDPVGNGQIASLARPGGNTTGLASAQDDSAPKLIDLLTMAVTDSKRFGIFVNPKNRGHPPLLQIVQAAGQKAGVQLVPMKINGPADIANALSTQTGERIGGLIVLSDSFFSTYRVRIAQAALKGRMPTIFTQREYVDVGGLMSYGESLADFFRRSASYVDRIFKGAKPADLPVEQPTRFFLVINLKTAKALNIDIPPKLLALAGDVIE